MEGNDHGIFEDTIPTFSGVSKENDGKLEPAGISQ
jgi:hypothetical protein